MSHLDRIHNSHVFEPSFDLQTQKTKAPPSEFVRCLFIIGLMAIGALGTLIAFAILLIVLIN